MKIRPIESKDSATIAYLILKWDNELPSWLKQLNGRADYAERTAQLLLNNPQKFVARICYTDDDELVGGYCINRAISIFNPEPYGQLLMWYVLPEKRGSKMYGLRLLMDALKTARNLKLNRLEVFPWADQENLQKTLKRLGLFEAVHVWVAPCQKAQTLDLS